MLRTHPPSCRLLGLLQVFSVAVLILISVLLSLLLHSFLPSESPAPMTALSVSGPELGKMRNLIQANVSRLARTQSSLLAGNSLICRSRWEPATTRPAAPFLNLSRFSRVPMPPPACHVPILLNRRNKNSTRGASSLCCFSAKK